MSNSRKARILALAEQQKQQITRENQEQKHRKRLEQQERETALYEEVYQNAQEDLNMFVKCWTQESNLYVL